MAEINVKEFEERLDGLQCRWPAREIVDCLRKAAEAHDPGEWIVLAHSAPGRSWGLTYKRGNRMFCSLDPKPMANHVCVSILDASETELAEAGIVHRRKGARPWVDVADVAGARRLEPLIARAFAAAGAQVRPRPVQPARRRIGL